MLTILMTSFTFTVYGLLSRFQGSLEVSGTYLLI